MVDRNQTSQRGISLIEVLVVLSILAVLTTAAVLSLGSSTKSLKRQNIAKSFKNSLERARFDSVKRRASECENEARVEITSATSFRLLTDANENGSIDPAEEAHAINFDLRDAVSIVYDHAVTYPVIIRFDRRGNPSSGPCGAEIDIDTPTVFCTMPCTAATADASNSNNIFVSKTGVVAFMDGGSTAPVFNAPTITTLDIGNQINRLLVVWDPPPPISPTPVPTATAGATTNPTITPTPSPTASPSADPTATPAPTPSVTPAATQTPTASPSPTATPRWCVLGEQPAIALCTCSPTQYLQAGSGKCRSL